MKKVIHLEITLRLFLTTNNMIIIIWLHLEFKVLFNVHSTLLAADKQTFTLRILDTTKRIPRITTYTIYTCLNCYSGNPSCHYSVSYLMRWLIMETLPVLFYSSTNKTCNTEASKDNSHKAGRWRTFSTPPNTQEGLFIMTVYRHAVCGGDVIWGQS